ncbi:hypothetical protein AXF42_Ash003352 [Apostasia shenzhenica]|uniref:Uncharacterized protein n=1 Tax=Apostasia shenzhenica TaxID=1088818 RepID=A0A2I0BFW3_9ASPA|nr:hypothetical protein AXF42_Ash003352 [Apostasia shenzhenica]
MEALTVSLVREAINEAHSENPNASPSSRSPPISANYQVSLIGHLSHFSKLSGMLRWATAFGQRRCSGRKARQDRPILPRSQRLRWLRWAAGFGQRRCSGSKARRDRSRGLKTAVLW